MTAEYIERLSKREIPDQITEEYKGDFNKIKDNLNLLVSDIHNVLKETADLSKAIQDVQLEVRGNTEAFGGGWRELIVGMNNVIEAFVKPITMAATHIDRIAKGDIPEEITEEYKGDFNQIKENLNLLIEASNDVTRLAREIAEGNLLVEVNERSTEDTLMQALNTMITKLHEVVRSVKAAADNVAAGSPL